MTTTKCITQETFDGAVKENIDEFDMTPDEALQSAIDEFQSQGYNLSTIIKSSKGGNIEDHPAAAAVKLLTTALQQDEETKPSIDIITAQLEAIHVHLTQSTLDGPNNNNNNNIDETLLILHKAEATPAVVQCLECWPDSTDVLLPSLTLLQQFLTLPQHKSAFRQSGGHHAIARIVSTTEPSNNSTTTNTNSVVASALKVIAVAATQSEADKGEAMSSRLGVFTLSALKQHTGDRDVTFACCAVLNALTSPDDESAQASCAFPNARALAREGAVPVLVAALRLAASVEASEAVVVVAVCNALKLVAANDEICQEAAAEGAIDICLDIMRSYTSKEDRLKGSLRAALGLLRQLVSSDSNKTLFVEGGGLNLINSIISCNDYEGAQEADDSSSPPPPPAVSEQACGILTNVFLRNPEVASQAAECGLLTSLLTLLKSLLTAPSAPRAGAATRQVCMALRNAAARSPELRPALLEAGAEELLRMTKQVFGQVCSEAATAALRDLGVDDYNE